MASKVIKTKFFVRQIWTNSADPEQTAPSGRAGSSHFAIPFYIFWKPCLVRPWQNLNKFERDFQQSSRRNKVRI